MTAAIPALEAYVAGLPQGLDSYPAFEQKASIFRVFLTGVPIAAVTDRLPAQLATLVASPPPVNSWMSEVHANAVFTAVRSECYPDDDAFVRAAYRNNAQLLASPLYSILFKLVSPERVARGAAARWAQLHRGMTLAAIAVSQGSATLRLRTPPGLVTPLIARCYATAFRAALEAASGRDVNVEVSSDAAEGFRFQASWL